jgi:hypothetical protein
MLHAQAVHDVRAEHHVKFASPLTLAGSQCSVITTAVFQLSPADLPKHGGQVLLRDELLQLVMVVGSVRQETDKSNTHSSI